MPGYPVSFVKFAAAAENAGKVWRPCIQFGFEVALRYQSRILRR